MLEPQIEVKESSESILKRLRAYADQGTGTKQEGKKDE